MTWTPEMKELTAKLWDEGFSGSQIASKLGDVKSRSAVLACLDRMGKLTRGNGQHRASRQGVPSKLAVQRHRASIEAKARHAAPVPVSMPVITPLPLPPEPVDVPRNQLVSLLDLEAHHCRWPVGDPESPEFGFCGARRGPIGVYCLEHKKASVAPPLARSPMAGYGLRQLNRRVA